MEAIARELYHDIPVLRLQAGAFVARLCPDMGGNLIQFGNPSRGAEALRTPPDFETLRTNPNVYGTPLLFPPNRVCDGTYAFQGRTYTFPINEPDRNNFIHGTLSGTPFAVLEERAEADCAAVTLGYAATVDKPYLRFPHAFTLTLRYELRAGGDLTQTVTVRNDSSLDMPFGLGFHTALHTPADADCRLTLTAGREWLLERTRVRPNGQYAVETPLHQALNGNGLPLQGTQLSNLVENTGNRMVLTHAKPRATLTYEVDPGYRYFMLWNPSPDCGFVCVEPQTWTVDAPNSPLPWSESGCDASAPGDFRRLSARLSLRLG